MAFYVRDKKHEREPRHRQEFEVGDAVRAAISRDGRRITAKCLVVSSEYRNGEWRYQLQDSDGKLVGGGAPFKESELSWAVPSTAPDKIPKKNKSEWAVPVSAKTTQLETKQTGGVTSDVPRSTLMLDFGSTELGDDNIKGISTSAEPWSSSSPAAVIKQEFGSISTASRHIEKAWQPGSQNDADMQVRGLQTREFFEALWQVLVDEMTSLIDKSLSRKMLKDIFESSNARVQVVSLLRILFLSIRERIEYGKVSRHLRVFGSTVEFDSSIVERITDKLEKLSKDQETVTAQDLPVELDEVENAWVTLLSREDLNWLRVGLERIPRVDAAENAYINIRGRLTDAIEALQEHEKLSMLLCWNPAAFLSNLYQAGERLGQTVVYMGTGERSYATTVQEYATWAWPTVGQVVVNGFEKACEKEPGTFQMMIGTVSLNIQLHAEGTSVWISQPYVKGENRSTEIHDMLQISEACIWLSAACQENILSDSIGICMPEVQNGDEANTLETGTNVDSELRPKLTINLVHSRFKVKGHDSVCWMNMVRNPVLLPGYPVPRRSAREQKGLELSVDLMIALSQADWATTFDRKMLLIGFATALVPVAVGDKWITWHFIINEDLARIEFAQACKVTELKSADMIDVTSLSAYRHFVGVWTARATSFAGCNEPGLYPLGPSGGNENTKKFRLALSNITIGGGMFVTATAVFALGKKDKSTVAAQTATWPPGLYIGEASSRTVLLYSDKDRRAWLVDGASAVLHLARAWLSSEEGAMIPMRALKMLQDGTWPCTANLPGGKEHAKAALAMNARNPVGLFDDAEVKEEKVEDLLTNRNDERSAASSSTDDSNSMEPIAPKLVRHERITTTIWWTYRDLLIGLCNQLQQINETLLQSDSSIQGVSLPGLSKDRLLLGFDAADLLKSRGPHTARIISNLDAHAENWTKFAREIRAIVLLADSFGDMIRPSSEPDECPRTSLMPSGHDLLAIPIPLLRSIGARYKKDSQADALKGHVQLSESYEWHSFHGPSDKGTCRAPCDCRIYSRIGPANTQDSRRNAKSFASLSEQSVFDLYGDGAAIIGGGTNKIERSPKTILQSPQPNKLVRKRRHSQSTHVSRAVMPSHPGDDNGAHIVPAQASSASQSALPVRQA